MKEHWDRVYKQANIETLGWYEQNAEPSFRLINQCKLQENASILNVGSGASTMVDELLVRGFKNILANDISANALEALKKRLDPEQSDYIHWIVDDIIHPISLQALDPVDLWHDRAVLHFFTDPLDQLAYFKLLKSLVKRSGFVIIATFSLKGATECSGLPVNRYNREMLEEKLGEEFQIRKAFDYTYTNPSGGTREYIYTLFQRKA